MYRSPIIWADTTQFTADTIHMQLAEDQLDKILLYNRSLILNSADELYFNQIKGRDIIAQFDSSELRRMDIQGNAQSVYYPRDETEAYVGVNKTICSDMVVFFGNNQVDEILFTTQLEGKLEPMTTADHEALKLEGFNWQGSPPRPRSLSDLFGPPLRVLPAPGAAPAPKTGTQRPAGLSTYPPPPKPGQGAPPKSEKPGKPGGK
jgi:hypothetical protein